jgi:hypothetical protein
MTEQFYCLVTKRAVFSPLQDYVWKAQNICGIVSKCEFFYQRNLTNTGIYEQNSEFVRSQNPKIVVGGRYLRLQYLELISGSGSCILYIWYLHIRACRNKVILPILKYEVPQTHLPFVASLAQKNFICFLLLNS